MNKTCANTHPTKRSSYAAVWNLEIPRDHPRTKCTIASWVLKAPNAHPVFVDYLVTLIHLRELEGWEPVKKRSPEVTHELLIFALAPNEEVYLDTDAPFALLEPVNVDVQFVALSDASALLKIEYLLGLVVSNELSPDSDYRHHWTHLLGRKLAETAKLN